MEIDNKNGYNAEKKTDAEQMKSISLQKRERKNPETKTHNYGVSFGLFIFTEKKNNSIQFVAERTKYRYLES